MKRNLILSLALLAFSIPSFAFGAPKPCNDGGPAKLYAEKNEDAQAKSQEAEGKQSDAGLDRLQWITQGAQPVKSRR